MITEAEVTKIMIKKSRKVRDSQALHFQNQKKQGNRYLFPFSKVDNKVKALAKHRQSVTLWNYHMIKNKYENCDSQGKY